MRKRKKEAGEHGILIDVGPTESLGEKEGPYEALWLTSVGECLRPL